MQIEPEGSLAGKNEPEDVHYATPSEIPRARDWVWYYAWGLTRYRCPGCNLYFSIGDKAYIKTGLDYYCEPCLLKMIW